MTTIDELLSEAKPLYKRKKREKKVMASLLKAKEILKTNLTFLTGEN